MALIAARSVLSAGLGLLKGGHRSAFPVVKFNVSRSLNILWNQVELLNSFLDWCVAFTVHIEGPF